MKPNYHKGAHHFRYPLCTGDSLSKFPRYDLVETSSCHPCLGPDFCQQRQDQICFKPRALLKLSWARVSHFYTSTPSSSPQPAKQMEKEPTTVMS